MKLWKSYGKVFLLFIAFCILKNPKEEPKTKEEPKKTVRVSEEKKAKFSSSDLVLSKLDVLPKKRGLRAEHYPSSNERRLDLFIPYVENLGGGYVGVGTDQNLSLIAKARSEYAYLMDFDMDIVRVNKMHIFLLKHSETSEIFMERWKRQSKAKTKELIAKEGGTETDDLLKGLEMGHVPYLGVPERFAELSFMNKKFGFVTFTSSKEEYDFLRELALSGRLNAVPGNLLGDTTIGEISAVAQKISVPIRVFYTSNAEEYFSFPKEYRENLKKIHTDEKGVLVRTVSAGTKNGWGQPDGEKFPDSVPFHYNIHNIQNLQKWADSPGKLTIPQLLLSRTPVKKGFSIFEKLPPEPKKQ
ncbi:MAG TPA: hypothetical protein PK453_25875 [Leptospiraceae bacterium]|nr:hypothetical protein [Leptospiraceae bacterium]HMY67678.1 hypothetical protein [Leptospiraceae bacterium]HNF17112.1 hypothetical protein [Leptospiraceae bacterium]HNM05773.1 hypothetical protein [Leptospiraceae bacterium]HNN05417.1 hypothetical protein [Leptospiraceae bacterium]